jgi:hypothetical protein
MNAINIRSEIEIIIILVRKSSRVTKLNNINTKRGAKNRLMPKDKMTVSKGSNPFKLRRESTVYPGNTPITIREAKNLNQLRIGIECHSTNRPSKGGTMMTSITAMTIESNPGDSSR